MISKKCQCFMAITIQIHQITIQITIQKWKAENY